MGCPPPPPPPPGFLYGLRAGWLGDQLGPHVYAFDLAALGLSLALRWGRP